jgi:hypothetical protein
VSQRDGGADGGPRHTRQPTVPQQRRATVSIAEALRVQFPPHADAAQRSARLSVTEALRSRFPQPRTPAEDDLAVASARRPASAGRPAGPVLPRRLRRTPVSARQAQPASAALLRRVLDGLHRL